MVEEHKIGEKNKSLTKNQREEQNQCKRDGGRKVME